MRPGVESLEAGGCRGRCYRERACLDSGFRKGRERMKDQETGYRGLLTDLVWNHGARNKE